MIKKIEKLLIATPTNNVHASTLARIGNDSLLAWFGGTQEGHEDVDIYMSRIFEGGGYSKPVMVAGEAHLPHWNPVLYAKENRVDLFYKVGHEIPIWHTRHAVSLDGANTFTTPRALVAGDVGGRGPVRNKPIRLKSGRVLAPASVETESAWDAFVDITTEEFSEFTRSANVPLWRGDEKMPCCEGSPAPFHMQGKGVIQPTLWQSEDGSVHMLLRSTEGYVLRSDSLDEGESWCPAYSAGLPNNNSGIDLVRMENGLLALVLNPVQGNWAARTPLSLYVSQDDGNSFALLMHFEITLGEYSYPAIVTEGNRLFVSYTWKRTHIAYWQIELE